MIGATAANAAARPRQFQFTLGTLLVVMTWAGLVCVALRSPTAFWAGALFVLTLLMLLTILLVAIYRTGRTRAFAVGFLVFNIGYLLCLSLVAGSLASALRQGWTPVEGVADWLFDTLHPPITVQAPASSLPGPGGMMGSPDGGGMPGGEGAMMGPGGYGGPGMPGGGGPGYFTYTQAPPYKRPDFCVICNLAIACALGLLGGVVAQMLNASRREGESTASAA